MAGIRVDVTKNDSEVQDLHLPKCFVIYMVYR